MHRDVTFCVLCFQPGGRGATPSEVSGMWVWASGLWAWASGMQTECMVASGCKEIDWSWQVEIVSKVSWVFV